MVGVRACFSNRKVGLSPDRKWGNEGGVWGPRRALARPGVALGGVVRGARGLLVRPGVGCPDLQHKHRAVRHTKLPGLKHAHTFQNLNKAALSVKLHVPLRTRSRGGAFHPSWAQTRFSATRPSVVRGTGPRQLHTGFLQSLTPRLGTPHKLKHSPPPPPPLFHQHSRGRFTGSSGPLTSPLMKAPAFQVLARLSRAVKSKSDIRGEAKFCRHLPRCEVSFRGALRLALTCPSCCRRCSWLRQASLVSTLQTTTSSGSWVSPCPPRHARTGWRARSVWLGAVAASPGACAPAGACQPGLRGPFSASDTLGREHAPFCTQAASPVCDCPDGEHACSGVFAF